MTRPGKEGMENAAMRTDVNDSIGNCRGREHDSPSLVAPELFARACIQGIEEMVLRTDVDNAIRNGRRGADAVPGGVAPYAGACAGIDRKSTRLNSSH